MGEQRTQEVTMFTLLFFLSLGIIGLLAAAGRIWIEGTSSDIATIDSAAANSLGESMNLRQISGNKDSVV